MFPGGGHVVPPDRDDSRRTRTLRGDYTSPLAEEHLGKPQEELEGLKQADKWKLMEVVNAVFPRTTRGHSQ